MECSEYEVVIRRVETCSVKVMASSQDEAIGKAVELEALGLVANHAYSDESAEARAL